MLSMSRSAVSGVARCSRPVKINFVEVLFGLLCDPIAHRFFGSVEKFPGYCRLRLLRAGRIPALHPGALLGEEFPSPCLHSVRQLL